MYVYGFFNINFPIYFEIVYRYFFVALVHIMLSSRCPASNGSGSVYTYAQLHRDLGGPPLKQYLSDRVFQ
jgi:hypothetical protein